MTKRDRSSNGSNSEEARRFPKPAPLPQQKAPTHKQIESLADLFLSASLKDHQKTRSGNVVPVAAPVQKPKAPTAQMAVDRPRRIKVKRANANMAVDRAPKPVVQRAPSSMSSSSSRKDGLPSRAKVAPSGTKAVKNAQVDAIADLFGHIKTEHVGRTRSARN